MATLPLATKEKFIADLIAEIDRWEEAKRRRETMRIEDKALVFRIRRMVNQG